MEECCSVVKSRIKIPLTTTWRIALQRVLAEKMTMVDFEVSSMPFGSWCRIQPPRLQYNLVGFLVAYLCVSTKDSHRLYARCGQGSHKDSSVIRHLSSPLQRLKFVSDCPIPDLDMTSCIDDFTLLAFVSCIVEAETRPNQLPTTLLRWANGKQLDIARQKISVTLLPSV